MSQESFDDFPQWREDFRALLRLAQTSAPSKSDYADAETHYFELQYPDAAFRQHRRQRVTAALRWLDANTTEIAKRSPRSVILGDGDAQIEDRVVMGLYAMYSRCPADHLNDPFPVDILLGYLE